MRGALLFAVVLAGGCGAPAPGPRETLREYVEAASRGDCAAAYAQMSSAFRAETSRDELCQAIRDNPAELRETMTTLRHVEGEPEVTARVRYGLGDELDFVLEGGRWRIDSPVFDFYGQETPRAALRSFVRAVERERYDVILRFVPAAYRERMSAESIRTLWQGDKREEIQQLLENLRASLDEPIEEAGDTATMQYMDRFTCRFVREDGLWRIEDPD